MSDVKQFTEFIKKYFISISSRRAVYAFFNVMENKNIVVLSNTDGELFGDFSPGELSFHYVEFKGKEALNYLKELKMIFCVGEEDVEMRNVSVWFKYLNKVGFDKITVFDCPIRKCCVISDIETADEAYKVDQIFGGIVHDSYLKFIITNYTNYMLNLVNGKYPKISDSVNLKPKGNKNIHYETIDVSELFPDCKEVTIISFDGLSIPSLSDFITKNKIPFSFTRTLYAETSMYLKWVYFYEDENVRITTLRPNIGVYPISGKQKEDISS